MCRPIFSHPEASIRTFAVSLIGAAALAAGLFLLKQQKDVEGATTVETVPPGETVPSAIVLERLRAAGI